LDFSAVISRAIGRGGAAAVVFCALLLPAVAQEAPFAPGWVLDPAASSLTFQSVKNGTKVEQSTFASYQGEIAPDGTATIRIQLDSVDTKVDLRNVRMRFLFFETFKFPEAIVSVHLDRAALADLPTRRRMQLPLTYELDLHGVRQSMETRTVVTLISEELVSVASVEPIQIALSPFDLEEGMRKLQDAANVTIVPSGSVSFDFVFQSRTAATEKPAVAAAPAASEAAAAPAATAVETSGNFSKEECEGRFEILSRTGAIYFRSGSAALGPNSTPLLGSLIAIVNRCPELNIVVEGHTDSAGPDGYNQSLSEARAQSVTDYLVAHGVPPSRLRSVGYGETRPVAPNDTSRNRGRNRRIEFTVLAL